MSFQPSFRPLLIGVACVVLFAALGFAAGERVARSSSPVARESAAPGLPPPIVRVPEPLPPPRERQLPADDPEGRWPLLPPAGPYALRIEHPGTVGMEPPHGELRLFHRETGETVWREEIRALHLVRWSSDGRAVVVLDVGDRDDGWGTEFQPLLWWEGESPRRLTGLLGFGDERVLDMAWCPASRRLLAITSGGWDPIGLHHGYLMVLDPATEGVAALPGPESSVGSAVTRAEWVAPDRVRYAYLTGDVELVLEADGSLRGYFPAATAEVTVP